MSGFVKASSQFLAICGLFLGFSLAFQDAQAQPTPARGPEQISPLRFGIGRDLEGQQPVHPTRSPNSAAKTSALDTLPFFDDFSSYTGRPDPNRWMPNGGAWVNRTSTNRPTTIGMVTFDGLFYDGYPYDSNLSQTAYGEADTLTSIEINLSTYNINSGLFLSFFYQAGGLGDAPDIDDSLVVEFRNISSTTGWERVWRTPGALGDTAFRRVLLPINKLNYLNGTFQFRFINYASLFGDYDHWNVDYIRLDDNRSANDTILNDLYYKQIPSTHLKTYFEMPWDHFIASPTKHLTDSLDLVIGNGGIVPVNALYNYKRTIPQLTPPIVYSSQSFSTLNQAAGTEKVFQANVVRFDSSLVAINAPFDFVHDYFLQGGNFDLNERTSNNQIRLTNRFRDYFAYDDGSAEYSYGINVARAQLAVRFTLDRPDTLRSVDMFFTQQNEDVSSETFILIIWSNLSTAGELLAVDFQKPRYAAGRNTYVNYDLDSALVLPAGDFYVGWLQEGSKLLNLGVDANRRPGPNQFVNFAGGWQQSLIQGSWMIRPVFGNANSLGLPKTTESIKLELTLYPNPTQSSFSIAGEVPADASISIYDMQGRKVKTFGSPNVNNSYDAGQLAAGIYTVHIRNTSGATFVSTLSITP